MTVRVGDGAYLLDNRWNSWDSIGVQGVRILINKNPTEKYRMKHADHVYKHTRMDRGKTIVDHRHPLTQTSLHPLRILSLTFSPKLSKENQRCCRKIILCRWQNTSSLTLCSYTYTAKRKHIHTHTHTQTHILTHRPKSTKTDFSTVWICCNFLDTQKLLHSISAFVRGLKEPSDARYPKVIVGKWEKSFVSEC